MLPLIGLYVSSATGSLYWGLAYPVTVAAITFVRPISCQPKMSSGRKAETITLGTSTAWLILRSTATLLMA